MRSIRQHAGSTVHREAPGRSCGRVSAPPPKPRLCAGGRRRKESGFALLMVFLMAAVIGIMWCCVAPSVVFQARRQKEQLLMERGEQFTRAIQLFYRRNHRYPGGIGDLESFTSRRYLRRRYVDPVTCKDDWRIVQIGPGGASPPPETNPAGPAAGDGEALPPATRLKRGAAVTPGSEEAAPVPSGPTPSAAGDAAGNGSSPGPTLSAASGAPGALQPPPPAPVVPVPLQLGGTMAGVASRSESESIMVLNGRVKYNQWEFVYDLRKDPLVRGGFPGAGRAGVVAREIRMGQP